MSKLYEPCTLCHGSDDVEGFEHCPSCGGKGFIEIGLTSRQVDRLVQAERVRLGDPGVGPLSDPAASFTRLVQAMRAKQRSYFKTRDSGDLADSKALEREVDRQIAEALDDRPSLFDPRETIPR